MEHNSETERIILEDEDPEVGFILLPDMKWTGNEVENLYLQAIVHRRDLRSVRDLRGQHIPLLRNVYEKCTVSSRCILIFYYAFNIHPCIS